jgi:hypothetical protein
VDFGRVINDASSHPSGDDTSFLQGDEDVMLATPAMRDAFDSLRRLSHLFEHRVWIVSKAGEKTQANTEKWLVHHDFFAATSIPLANVSFVRRRKDKAAVCRALHITHFVDDRSQVLEALRGLVSHLFLFGPQDRDCGPGFEPVLTWELAEAAIMRSME